MPEIVLTTLNARYHHTAFGLRYLQANLGELQERSVLLEFGINESPAEVLAAILEQRPRIVGLGVYIWNVAEATRLATDLKRLCPEVVLILGGPEVSYDTDDLEIVRIADYVIAGEADVTFPRVCREILAGRPPVEGRMEAELPALGELRLPYELYTDEDIAQRVIYVEASRGCPFTCEFCLSALEIPVRQFDVEAFLAAMQGLYDRGARWFKFVDRTFNLNLRVGRRILEFFLERYEPGMFLHFEMIPDRLPEGLREVIARFPAGALQFEVGIQTFNDDVSERISRRQDNARVAQNFQFLRGQTGVHIHADLIVGLPGEDLESFGAGFDRLVGLGPHEIQVGILKRLRGTPIVRHDGEWGMVYSASPPYEILSTGVLSFETIQRLRRLAQLWDRVANSGNLSQSVEMLWREGSPFARFLAFSDWVFAETGRSHGIALARQAELLFRYLTEELGQAKEEVAQAIWSDFQRAGRTDKPAFLRGFALEVSRDVERGVGIPARQARHVGRREES